MPAALGLGIGILSEGGSLDVENLFWRQVFLPPEEVPRQPAWIVFGET